MSPLGSNRRMAKAPTSTDGRTLLEEACMDNIVINIAVISACLLFFASIVTDLRRRQIPNTIPILLLVLFAIYAGTGGIRTFGILWEHLAVGGIILIVGFALYLTGRFGGGDSKLLAVAGVWVGPSPLYLGFFLCGLAIFAFALSMVSLLPIKKSRCLRTQLPFAVAIAPPAVMVLSLRALTDGL